ncbi:hypothetical protein MMPV_007351 [Pyropia vietnamensis]
MATLRVPAGTIVLPGDIVADLPPPDLRPVTSAGSGGPPTPRRPIVRVGPGLAAPLPTVAAGDGNGDGDGDGDGGGACPPRIVSNLAGTLMAAPPPRQRLRLATRTRRYSPATGDVVIGTILDRNIDGYRVSIGASEAARLPGLAFAGATKRNKPTLLPGALLFGRVAAASRATEAELTCVEVGENVSWLSGEATYGELVGGNVVRVGLDAARRLMAGGGGGGDGAAGGRKRAGAAAGGPGVLAALGEVMSFEVVVGLNGRVWIKADQTPYTVLICNAIARVADMEVAAGVAAVRKLMAQVVRA